VGSPRTRSITYASLRLTATVVCESATVDGFETLKAALYAAWRTPNGDLLIEDTGAGSPLLSLTHAAATGFNARAEVEELGPEHRTDRSGEFRLVVEFGLPADEVGKGFRAAAEVEIEVDDLGLKTARITANYTAGASTSASANAAAGFPAFVAAILAAAGGGYDTTLAAITSRDDEDKIATIATERRELAFNQSAGLLDDTRLFGVEYTISTERIPTLAPVGSGGEAPVTVEIIFAGGLPRLSPADQDPVNTVENVVLPYIDQLVVTITPSYASGTVVRTGDKISIVPGGPSGRRASGVVRYQLFGSAVVAAFKEVEDDETPGATYVPVLDGSQFGRDLHTGPATFVRRVFISTRETVAAGVSAVIDSLAGSAELDASAAGYALINRRRSVADLEFGVRGKVTIPLVDRAITLTFLRVEVELLGAVVETEDASSTSGTRVRAGR